MTLEALNYKIRELIIARSTADQEEQKRLNIKLDKLYNLKYIMIEQRS